MNTISRYIHAASIACLLGSSVSSCTEEIDLKLDSTYARLVVDAIITTDTAAQCVKLTLSGDYFDNQPMPGVSNALVTLNDGTSTITLVESAEHAGWYYTPDDFYGKQNYTYTLNISNVDVNNDGQNESYSASSYLNPLIPIDTIDIGYSKEYKLWKVLLYAYEPGNTENYYMFRVVVNDTLVTNKYSKCTITDDQFVNGNYMNGVWICSLDPKETLENLAVSDTVVLEMYNIEEATYDYMSGVVTETQPKTPLFSGPPANVPGNISNGALGIFAACAVSRSTTIVKKPKNEY